MIITIMMYYISSIKILVKIKDQRNLFLDRKDARKTQNQIKKDKQINK